MAPRRRDEPGSAVRQFRENIEVAAPMAFFPFNGIKASFYGDLHAAGKDGVRFFTENKVEIISHYSDPPGEHPVVQRPVESGPYKRPRSR